MSPHLTVMPTKILVPPSWGHPGRNLGNPDRNFGHLGKNFSHHVQPCGKNTMASNGVKIQLPEKRGVMRNPHGLPVRPVKPSSWTSRTQTTRKTTCTTSFRSTAPLDPMSMQTLLQERGAGGALARLEAAHGSWWTRPKVCVGVRGCAVQRQRRRCQGDEQCGQRRCGRTRAGTGNSARHTEGVTKPPSTSTVRVGCTENGSPGQPPACPGLQRWGVGCCAGGGGGG